MKFLRDKQLHKYTFGLFALLTSISVNSDGMKMKSYSVISILISCILISSCHKKHEIDFELLGAYYTAYTINQNAANAARTGCRNIGGDPFEYEIDISTPGDKQCGYVYDQTKTGGNGVILDYTTWQKINPIEVNIGTQLACRCVGTNSPLTGETQWYRRNNPTEIKATLFFTHVYQKDGNGNITGINPFIPNTSGDTYYCLLSVCGYKGIAYLIRIK